MATGTAHKRTLNQGRSPGSPMKNNRKLPANLTTSSFEKHPKYFGGAESGEPVPAVGSLMPVRALSEADAAAMAELSRL